MNNAMIFVKYIPHRYFSHLQHQQEILYLQVVFLTSYVNMLI